jgi:phytol kinase
LRLNDFAAERNWISSRLSRKIIHMGTGPLFVLCWPLFDGSAYSRYVAALVPLLITVQFILVGVGLIHDEAAVRAMSRSGERREILRGPLFYGLVFVMITIFYWSDSPSGIIALMLMCGGDGLADILGRRYGRAALPWNRGKTWIGSLGMFLGGWTFAVAVVAVFANLGYFPGTLGQYLPGITLIALAGTTVESLPFRDVDNLTVTATALVIGALVF